MIVRGWYRAPNSKIAHKCETHGGFGASTLDTRSTLCGINEHWEWNYAGKDPEGKCPRCLKKYQERTRK